MEDSEREQDQSGLITLGAMDGKTDLLTVDIILMEHTTVTIIEMQE